jgi:beta-N-acetylhexosaminidase
MMKAIAVLGLSAFCLLTNAPGPTASLDNKVVDSAKIYAQQEAAWVDSVFESLSHEERIGQLIMIRMHSNLGAAHVNSVLSDIKNNKVGGLVTFQGGPIRQANLINHYQQISKVPLLIAVDGEWGLGMRFTDSVTSFPRNMLLGAVQDTQLIYRVGKAIGDQCVRMGIQYNFAPVLDVNNNPKNPVINDRSFGEDKYQVARHGIAMIQGMQDAGILACAKHFPGHGDTDVDSHYDLPRIVKSRADLDSLELYPFQKAIEAGVKSVMIAHLFVPSIDSKPNTPSSISYKTVTDLLKNEMGFSGLIVTDALEMKGISKHFNQGQESLQSLLAGNHLMELPSTAKGSIEAIAQAIKKKQITKEEVYARVKQVLRAKYEVGLHTWKPIATEQLFEDLNREVDGLNAELAAAAITVVENENQILPFDPHETKQRVAVLTVGNDPKGSFLKAVRQHKTQAGSFLFTFQQTEAQIPALIKRLKQDYDAVIIGVHGYSRRPANQYGISKAAQKLVNQLSGEMPTVTITFGNPYAIEYFEKPGALVAAYEDQAYVHQAAAEVVFGLSAPRGKLPVSIGKRYAFGTGLSNIERPVAVTPPVQHLDPQLYGMDADILQRIDSLAYDMIARGAAPGCQVVALKDGHIVLNKQFGYFDYTGRELVEAHSIYDVASITKIAATTLAIMKLYEEGKVKLDATLGTYVPWVRGNPKERLKIRDILLHEAGLLSFIPFYKDVLLLDGAPDSSLFSGAYDSVHTVRVAEGLYMDAAYTDVMRNRILESRLKPAGREYIYSDNDYIFLGEVVRYVSGMSLDAYVQQHFYEPLQLKTTCFTPRSKFPIRDIVPTEREDLFRKQVIRGDVHDPGAAMFGGVSGHAGLFSNAMDLARIMQMLLDGGTYNQQIFFKPETVRLFTTYGSKISRRGLGFDKPEKSLILRKQKGYPAPQASDATFGHTGFTGTCAWVDPKSGLVFVFLSNRVHPSGGNNNLLMRLAVREKMFQVLYDAIKVPGTIQAPSLAYEQFIKIP